MHCKTHTCPKILGRITQDHCHTEDMMLFLLNKMLPCPLHWFPGMPLPWLKSRLLVKLLFNLIDISSRIPSFIRFLEGYICYI